MLCLVLEGVVEGSLADDCKQLIINSFVTCFMCLSGLQSMRIDDRHTSAYIVKVTGLPETLGLQLILTGFNN